MVWTNREVETFLCILGEEDVQRDLDGAARNEKVFQLVSQKLLDAGFEKNTEQCRQKSKKLRADYRKAKDHNNQNGDYRKMWKWFNMMDAIYGHRLQSKGTEIDAANSMLESKLQPIGKSQQSNIINCSLSILIMNCDVKKYIVVVSNNYYRGRILQNCHN